MQRRSNLMTHTLNYLITASAVNPEWRYHMKKFYLTLLGATLLSGAAQAYDTNSSAITSPAVTGGVGMADRQALDYFEDEYNLKLVFTGEGGMYLSNVAVNIVDAQGNPALSATTEGPMLLANLKPGTYTVYANAEGFEKTQKVTIGESLKTLQVGFPVKDEYDFSLSSNANGYNDYTVTYPNGYDY